MQLYFRLGDQADYDSVDGIYDFVEVLKENGIVGPFTAVDLGLVCPQHQGQDYISAFWGHDVETPKRSLTKLEVSTINCEIPS